MKALKTCVAGCDVGSTMGKALVMGDGEVLGWSIIPCAVRPEMTAEHALGLALPGTALASQMVNALAASGHGELDCSALIKAVEKLNR